MTELTHGDFAAPEAALAQREADPAWTQRLLSGDVTARAEFKALSRAAAGLQREGVPASAAAADLAGVDLFAEDARARLPEFSVIGGNEVSDHTRLDLIEGLRARGYSEQLIREYMDDDRSYSPEIHAMAKDRWTELESDPAFRRALLAKEFWAEKLWRSYCTVASGNVKG